MFDRIGSFCSMIERDEDIVHAWFEVKLLRVLSWCLCHIMPLNQVVSDWFLVYVESW